MKKVIYVLVLIFFSFHSNAQSIKRIKDPHIVGQEKRQVFYEWGDWQPRKKKVFGVNVNYHYTMVWGWGAPARNRRYKDGADIRPLSADGLQNQRYASTTLQKNDADKIHDYIEKVYDEATNEMYHISSLTLQADPLYNLYYKQMLSKLEDFDTASLNLGQWFFTDTDAFLRFYGKGMLEGSKEKISTLKGKLDLAKNANMPRGKRILQLHDCLLEWRKIESYLKYLNKRGISMAKAQVRIREYGDFKKKGQVSQKQKRDAQIFTEVLLGHPNTTY